MINFLKRIRRRLAPRNTRRDEFVQKIFRKINSLTTGGIKKYSRKLPAFIRRPIVWIYHVYEDAILSTYRSMLKDILAQHSDFSEIIVFAPSLAWQVQLFQRPQQLALALARQGALVFYLEPEYSRSATPFQQIRERLYWCHVPARTFNVLNNPFVYLLTWNSDYITSFRDPWPIYDYVDDIDVFYGDREQIIIGHELLICQAKLLLVTAANLFEQIQNIRPDAVYCPNGVDEEHFASLRQPSQEPVPGDLAPILEKGCPIIGYYGALARWFDYDLFRDVVRQRQEYSFVLIGPDYDRTLHGAGIMDFDNVFWLGVKSYEELPEYLRYFDVAIIPFKLNKITHATSPLKLFEYMSAGKPVVITPMEESMRYSGVLIADNSDYFAKELDQALLLKNDPQYKEVIYQVAKENTWDIRAQQIINHLSRLKLSDQLSDTRLS